MRNAICGVVLALALGACKSNTSSCEALMHRVLECKAHDLDVGDAEANKAMRDIADNMITEECKDSDIAAGARELSSCTDESDCAAFNACLEKKAPGLDLMGN